MPNYNHDYLATRLANIGDPIAAAIKKLVAAIAIEMSALQPTKASAEDGIQGDVQITVRLNEEEVEYLAELAATEGRRHAVLCDLDDPSFNMIVSILEKFGCTETAYEVREIRADKESL